MFTKKTIRDTDLHGKTVLLRADFNVPIKDGKVIGDYRLQQTLPTIRALQDADAKIVVCSHLGRPNGKPDKQFSMEPVARRLSEILGQEVEFVDDCVGEKVQQAAKNLAPKKILLLENLRFHPEEEANDEDFAAELANPAEVFVQDAFGVVHRAHASLDAITHHLPSVAGLLLEKEVDTITNVMSDPKRPLAAIIGGAKISTKIEVLNKFIEIADFLAIGGAMANTFLVAKGMKVGKSKYDADDLEVAHDIMAKAEEKAKNGRFAFYLPQDFVVSKTMDGSGPTRLVDLDAHRPALTLSYPQTPTRESGELASDEMILDIGPFSSAFIAGSIQLAGTVIWNGTVGITEVPGTNDPVGPFAHGTETIIEALAGDFGHKPYSLVGGGDTASYIEERGLTSSFNFVSTGGGASLELMAGRQLPGVESLQNK